MAITRDTIEQALRQLTLPDGGDLISRDMVRALTISGGSVRFVIEAPSPAIARQMEPLRAAAEQIVARLPGVESASVALTAHGPADKPPAPSLKIGGHPTPQAGPTKPSGVDRILAIGSGKGGVGKSTVSSNLAVALARLGRRVGLLDADLYGPNLPRMMGVSRRPASPDGQTLQPITPHAVSLMSLGLLLQEGKAVIWRGPMLIGALQQLLAQVASGPLDVLLIDLPHGTGDIPLTLCQHTAGRGAAGCAQGAPRHVCRAEDPGDRADREHVLVLLSAMWPRGADLWPRRRPGRCRAAGSAVSG